MLVVLGACGTETGADGPPPFSSPVRPIEVSPDGRLECSPDQVIRGADIVVFASTEAEIVEKALIQWTTEGAMLEAWPELEWWSAVIDDTDVAVAVPEQNGDGQWIVHDVQMCGVPDTDPAPIDGELDCAGDESWGQQGTRDPTIPGFETREEAIRDALEPFRQEHGGEIVILDGKAASLVIDGRERVIAPGAGQVPAGGWAVTTISGCIEYRRSS